MIARLQVNCNHLLMNAAKIIATKRDGQRIADADLAELIQRYAKGGVPDYQMAAFAMAVFFQGMQPDETVTLTREMRDSGQVMQWPDIDRPIVDKHSTGGIGDKISIPLAPMLAACGLAVPMISGRGLGATGGTLDKLESIPGFRTDLSIHELQNVVREVGCVITGATDEIAPADRKLYALRDVTSTIPSVPLITGSILSKKLAEGLDALVLDVKWGSGSFMKTIEQAEELANSLVSVATKLGVKTTALLTDMNQPIGMVGNAVEIDQSIEILKNNVDLETMTLAIGLGTELLMATGIADDSDAAISKLSETIRSGSAYEIFEKMVAAQGGDLSRDRPCAREHFIESDRQGFIASVDTEALGWAVIEMGGGRRKMNDAIDHSIGLEWLVKIGDSVESGDPLMRVFSNDVQFNERKEGLRKSIIISETPTDPAELIVKRIAN